MMMNLSCDVIKALQGRTLATAESCTGGGIGAALTAVPGSSAVYKGGIVSYTNEVKSLLLGVPQELLDREGAVSPRVAQAMAVGVRKAMSSDIAVSVTGLAGPGGDEFGNPVGTVYIGYCDKHHLFAKHFRFEGDRESVRQQAVTEALKMILHQMA